MKRTLCALAAILVTVAIYAQNVEKVRWSPEFSAKAFVSVFHGSYEITAGARLNDSVFGLGSGYGMEFWDAYPAHVRKIPVCGFYRRYAPLGEKKRFLIFAEATLGGECVYNHQKNTILELENQSHSWYCLTSIWEYQHLHCSDV